MDDNLRRALDNVCGRVQHTEPQDDPAECIAAHLLYCSMGAGLFALSVLAAVSALVGAFQ